MKARLTKQQIKMLLDGKSLSFNRLKLVAPEDAKIIEVMKAWLENDAAQRRFDWLLDTNDMSLILEEKEAEE